MTTQQPNSNQRTHSETSNIDKGSSGRKILLLIVGIPITVILMSTLLYYLGESRSIELGTVNKGTLIIPPVRFSDIEKINTKDNKVHDYTNPTPKWTFVVFGGKECTDVCEKMLYLSRQSNTALAKKMNRVRRFYVSYEGNISQTLKENLDKNYKKLTVLSMSTESIQQLFKDTGIDPYQKNQFFVVDERGWLMMYYTANNLEDHNLNMLGKDVLRDMKRLLK